MASVKRKDGPRGPRWEVRYRDPAGRDRSKWFDRAKAADDFMISVEHSKRVGSYVDPAGPRQTFQEMAERWKLAADHSTQTAILRDRDLRLHVYPAIGAMPLGRLTELELRAFRRRLGAKLGPASVVRVWGWVSSVCNAAVMARALPANPAAGLTPPKPARPQLVPLEAGQVEAIVGELPGRYRAAAVLAAGGGLRLGEVFGLSAGRVEWLAREPLIRVERQLITLSSPARRYLAQPKGGKSRTVPIGSEVTEALAAHMAAYPRAPVSDEVSGDELEVIFANAGGASVGRQPFDLMFRHAVERAGLAGVRFHDLRHYYAAVLIDQGIGERELGARLGHSSHQVTARYGHLFGHADDRTRAASSHAVRFLAWGSRGVEGV